MKIENEHLTIMALLMVLPLGLNGKTATPATDLLITLMAVSAVPTLFYYLAYRKNHPRKIGQLALSEKLLTPTEVKQILFCQKHCGEKFGKVAIKRNFLEEIHVNLLLEKQSTW